MQAKVAGAAAVDHTPVPQAGVESQHPSAAAPQTVIPVVREELDVGKRRVETGRGVRVHKTVQERQAVVDEPLAKDEVRVERVKVERTVEAPVDVRYEGDTMIIPVLEEVLVVQKRLVLKEEIRVTRRRSETRAPQRVTLRSEDAEIERIEGGDAGALEHRHVQEHSAHAEPPPATATTSTTSADDCLIERKRKQTELRRGRLAKPRLLY